MGCEGERAGEKNGGEGERGGGRGGGGTHHIPRVLDLLPLAPEVPKDIGSDVFGLERKAVRVFQAAGS